MDCQVYTIGKAIDPVTNEPNNTLPITTSFTALIFYVWINKCTPQNVMGSLYVNMKILECNKIATII